MTTASARPIPSKGARSFANLDPERLVLLNSGQIESAGLVEGLAIHLPTLMRSVLLSLGITSLSSSAEADLEALAALSFTKRMPAAARFLQEHFPEKCVQADFRAALAAHPSDTVRGISVYLCALVLKTSGETQKPEDVLTCMLPFAMDRHFSVREFAWLVARPLLFPQESDLLSVQKVLRALQPLALDTNDFIRRFAIEVCRPRGVWCAHIEVLKAHPEEGFGLLEICKKDPSLYVRKSVGNWLNDASKTHPLQVKNLCDSWVLGEGASCAATRQIVTKASRTMCKRENTNGDSGV